MSRLFQLVRVGSIFYSKIYTNLLNNGTPISKPTLAL